MAISDIKNSVWASKLQKIPLAFKFSSLHEALTSDEISVPGYIFDETNKLSFQSDGVSDEVLEFLLLTFDTSNPIQKLKALKVLKHLTVNGNINFREKLKKSDRTIKEATGFNGPYDAIHGNSLNITIRNESNDLMHLLFENVSEEQLDRRASVHQEKAHFYSGMGSIHHTGKYEGFGNTPIVTSKTVVDKVVDGINTMVDKIITTTDSNEIIQDALKMDSGSYLAVQMPAEELVFHTIEHFPPQKSTGIAANLQLKGHVPGRAGGGWEDDDNEVYLKKIDLNSATRNDKASTSCISTDSLETEQKLITEMEVATNDELLLVEDVLSKLAFSKSFLELELFCRRFTTLDYEKLLEILHSKLNSDNENTKLAVLILIEALLYQDIVAAELLNSVFSKSLELLAALSNTDVVNVKSKKISLILNKLIEQSSTR